MKALTKKNYSNNNNDKIQEISESILGEYNSFINRKLGLNKKIAANEICVYRYFIQLSQDLNNFNGIK